MTDFLRAYWPTLAAIAVIYVGASLAKMPAPSSRPAYVAWWVVRWLAFLTHDAWGGRLKLPFTPPVVEAPPAFALPPDEPPPTRRDGGAP